MLVAVPYSTTTRIPMQKEDVHFFSNCALAVSRSFFRYTKSNLIANIISSTQNIYQNGSHRLRISFTVKMNSVNELKYKILQLEKDLRVWETWHCSDLYCTSPMCQLRVRKMSDILSELRDTMVELLNRQSHSSLSYSI